MDIELTLVSAVTALVAVFVGPLVSVYVTKKQIGASADIAKDQINATTNIAKDQINTSADVAKNQINASVVSSNRQVWINRLRDEVATLVGLIHHLPSAHANNSISNEEAIAQYGKFIEKFQVVKLLINPNEKDHKDLILLIDYASKDVIKSINSNQASVSEFNSHGEKIIAQSQIVLKREWERVKNGE